MSALRMSRGKDPTNKASYSRCTTDKHQYTEPELLAVQEPGKQ